MFLNINSKILSTVVIISIIFVTLFGFIAINSMNQTAQHTCPTSIVSGSECPPIENSIALANHHISSLQQISQGMTNLNVFLSLMFILLIGVFIFLYFNFKKKEQYNYFLDRVGREIDMWFDFIPNLYFFRWFVLHCTLNPQTPSGVHNGCIKT